MFIIQIRCFLCDSENVLRLIGFSECEVISEMDQSAETVECPKNLGENPRESSCQIKTRKELSLKEKLEILKQYDKLPKMSQRSAAQQLKISQPVLCKILKNRNFIENIMRTNENSIRKRKRGGKEREIETALKLWYVDILQKNIPLNGHIIREKAKELAKKMGKEFAATDGWFTRWRKRENIVYNSIFRKKLKVEKGSDCSQNESNDYKSWVNDKVCAVSQIHSDTNCNSLIEEAFKQNSTHSNCQSSVTMCSEPKVPDMEESKGWERENKNMCDTLIKKELHFNEKFEFNGKSKEKPPTNEEMLEALRILNAGVKHRTSDLELHYEYEHFIHQLVK